MIAVLRPTFFPTLVSPRSAHHSRLRRGPRAGFALLITITLLAFLVILLVGLGVYTRVETSIAGNTQRQAQARQNALVGLNLAVAQLQKYAGPDTRVTATAESTTGAVAQKIHYTGVWDTAVPGASPVWLASGLETGTSPDVQRTIPAANQAALVARATDGTAFAGNGNPGPSNVTAALQPITAPGVPGQVGSVTIGRYAWWVGDQGVKAPVALPDLTTSTTSFDYAPFNTTESRRRLRQQLSLGAGATDAAGAAVFEPRDTTGNPTNASLAANTTALNQLAYFRATTGTVGLTNLRTNFHAWSVGNANVLASTNPATAGLRRDLSLRPDLLGSAFAAWANYSPARGGYMEDPAAPLTPAPLPDYTADPVRRRFKMLVPTESDGIAHRIAPVLSFFGISFSLRNDTQTTAPTQLQLSARCVVGLWNPYSSALVPEDLELVVDGLPLVVVTSTVDGVRRFVPLQNRLANSDGEVKFALPFTSDDPLSTTVTARPDRASWLPGRVYNWSAVSSTGDPGSSGYATAFYSRSAIQTGQGIIRDASAPIGPDTLAGAQNFRVCEVGFHQVLTFELRRASNKEVLARFRSPRFEPFVTSPTARKVGDSSADFAYVFRLPDRGEIPLNETAPWLESAGRDPREFNFPAGAQEGFIVAGGQDPRPELLINQGASSFDASFPQLLLDRYTTGLTYNEDAPVFELPRGPLLSLGSLQHLFIPGARPFAVGNSWGGDRNAWFDQYFFSGLTPETLWTDVTKPLPNPQLRVVRRKSDGNSVAVEDLNGADRQTDALSAKYLLQHGTFNLNSVSATAWAAVLRGVRFTAATNFTFLSASTGTGTAADTTTTLPEPFLTNSRIAGFPRFAQSAQETFRADDGYLQSDPATTSQFVANTPLFRRGIRFLTSAQVAALAQSIVALVRVKHENSGPFFTVQEFLSPSSLFLDAAGNQVSLLDKAIADAALNSDAALGLTDTTGQFSSQWLTQADLMTVLAPVLFTRSDTFIVRAYGEAVNPATGVVEGKAWCEALVQRTPEYFDPSEPAETAPTALTSPFNRANGRRFKTISFRWLTRSDI